MKSEVRLIGLVVRGLSKKASHAQFPTLALKSDPDAGELETRSPIGSSRGNSAAAALTVSGIAGQMMRANEGGTLDAKPWRGPLVALMLGGAGVAHA